MVSYVGEVGAGKGLLLLSKSRKACWRGMSLEPGGDEEENRIRIEKGLTLNDFFFSKNKSKEGLPSLAYCGWGGIDPGTFQAGL